MAKPYNASQGSLKRYIIELFVPVIREQEIIYKDIAPNKDGEIKTYIRSLYKVGGGVVSNDDISVLAFLLKNIIDTDYSKIYKLSKYLTSVAALCNRLNIPIT